MQTLGWGREPLSNALEEETCGAGLNPRLLKEERQTGESLEARGAAKWTCTSVDKRPCLRWHRRQGLTLDFFSFDLYMHVL